jgi:glycosyltransferase involved in cell wall biosynthesis
MKKIIVLAGYAPSLINFRGPLLAALRQGGHAVVGSAPEAGGATADKLQQIGVKYVQVEMSRAGIDPLGDLAYAWRLWRIFRGERPDIVISYTIKPATFGLLAARLSGVRHRMALITGLGYAFTDVTSWRKRLVRWFACRLYRVSLASARCVFFQNPDDHRTFEDLGILSANARVRLVNGSGVDLEHFRVAPLPEGCAFLMIARLLRDKGVMEYVEAARALKKRFPEVRCVLVGGLDPNPTAVSRQQLDDWIAEGAIEYLGELKDVRKALSDCAVYVLPSYREGTPRTVLEAMAAGRPIITTDAPGCRETVVHNDNGFLVPIRDPAALADAMLRFVESPDLVRMMGRRSRQIVEERYDVRKVNAVMLEAMGLA